MSTYTPGPWHLSSSGIYIRKNDSPGWPAWNIAEVNSDIEESTFRANAHLIAAAPELLAAIGSFLAAWDSGAYDPDELVSALQDHDIINDMRAAVAKARGDHDG